MTRGAFAPKSRALAIVLISTMLCAALSSIPQEAAAQIAAVQTQQLLPPGGNTCVPLTAYGFTPYIYDGALHSFEFSVSDKSYVAISGTLGGKPIPFLFMTRRSDSGGALRIHVDVETTPIVGTLPLSVSLLSAQGSGGVVCMSFVAMVAASGGQAPASIQTVTPPLTTPVSITPSVPSVTPSPIGGGQVIGGAASNEEATNTTPNIGGEAEEAADTSTGLSVVSSFQNKLVALCAAGNAPRLWIVLLTVFAVIMVIAALIQPPVAWGYSANQRVATLVAPLILLVAFWYFAESCRVSPWVLGAALLLGLVGILGIYRDHTLVKQYTKHAVSFFTTPEAPKSSVPSVSIKQTTMITPPPQQKRPPAPPELK